MVSIKIVTAYLKMWASSNEAHTLKPFLCRVGPYIFFKVVYRYCFVSNQNIDLANSKSYCYVEFYSIRLSFYFFTLFISLSISLSMISFILNLIKFLIPFVFLTAIWIMLEPGYTMQAIISLYYVISRRGGKEVIKPSWPSLKFRSHK